MANSRWEMFRTGKCFELGIPGPVPVLVFMVQMAKAGGELAASRAGPGHNYDWMLGTDRFVFAVTFVAYDGVNIRRITLCKFVRINVYSCPFELVLEHSG
jgi:hypothetical protein